ncbi:peptide chain release factor N(5)-glutamine methyltransferase [Flavobacterium agricola]|uniref:peptide chain release factor N(5)-glutamine methyltransferase n=1 Tax=Flavobacterium agricola TaxID=2870839 RepID=A0ABY6LZJ3_9FLAO|nr:peptide chain release factor N(5)-glutamine methyltransferase [Flavobacterium agricola]UYW01442.1 peptide chain release factor N(5)-glutamine methyltransferase [Flavobacterium agricola]
MVIKTYRDQFRAKLLDLYDETEVDNFFYRLLDAYTDVKKYQLAIEPELCFTTEQVDLFNRALDLLQNFTPIQYIVGHTYFYEGFFKVDSNTLIPRPETEELVDLIIKNHTNQPHIKVLDIGTGSGCIAISLASYLPQAQVTAFDVSEKALVIAAENAKLNKVQVAFQLQNILTTQHLENKYDIIVSNPPYVRNLEKQEIKPNVLEHEPHLALFVEDDNPLLFYKKTTELACTALTNKGVLYFEINQYLGPETVAMIQKFNVFQSVTLLQDMFGNDRIIVAKK